MQVGSLIFVVIVVTWAVYLLQHWIRRREDAAATRSADQFSVTMRVLEQRAAVPAVAAPAAPFVALHPRNTAPITAEVAPMSSSARVGASRPHPVERTPPARRPDTSGRSTGHDVPVDRAPRRAWPRPRVGRWRRQLRGVLLLLALIWVPASVALAALHVLLWISVPLAVLTLLAVLVWLRLEVRADRAGSASSLRSSGCEPVPEPTPGPAPARRTGSRQRQDRARLTSDDTQVIPVVEQAVPPPVVKPTPGEGPVRREASAAAYDIEAELARDAAPAPAPQPAPQAAPAPSVGSSFFSSLSQAVKQTAASAGLVDAPAPAPAAARKAKVLLVVDEPHTDW